MLCANVIYAKLCFKDCSYFTNVLFCTNNELIKTLEYFKLETLQPIIINGIIVLGFTLSFVLITLMISKRKQKIG